MSTTLNMNHIKQSHQQTCFKTLIMCFFHLTDGICNSRQNPCFISSKFDSIQVCNFFIALPEGHIWFGCIEYLCLCPILVTTPTEEPVTTLEYRNEQDMLNADEVDLDDTYDGDEPPGNGNGMGDGNKASDNFDVDDGDGGGGGQGQGGIHK